MASATIHVNARSCAEGWCEVECSVGVWYRYEDGSPVLPNAALVTWFHVSF